MIRRDWLTRWLTGHLATAREQVDLPIGLLAADMSDELLLQWSEGEARWWRAVADTRGITPAQRTMRLRVAAFYDERATGLRSVSTASQTVKAETEREKS